MSPDELKEKLSNIQEQISAISEQERLAFMELGKAALSELRDKAEFAVLAAQIDATGAKRAELEAQKTTLEAELSERLAALTCYVCKTVNPESAGFCEECGAKLGVKQPEYCDCCKTMNQTGQKFCGECGAKLEA